MLKKVSSWLNGDDKLVSVHVHVLEDETFHISILYLDLLSGYAKIIKEYNIGIAEFDSINDWPTKKAILCITGKGVLSRKLSTKNVEIQKKFIELYPTSNSNDFYISEYVSLESYLSFIKKDKLTSLLGVISNKIEFLDVNVGYLSLLNIYETILPDNLELQFQEGVVDKRDPLILKSSNVQHDVEMNGEKLPVIYLGAYLSAVTYLINGASYNQTDFTIKAERLKLEYHFNRFLILTVLIIFIALIINTIVYYSYEDKYNDLQVKKSVSGSNYADVIKLKTDIEQKKKIIKEIGLTNDLNIALFIQMISKKLPDNILFKSVEVFPNEAYGSKEKFNFNTHKVVVIGQSKDIVDVHHWIKELHESKKLQINLESYSRKTGNEMSQFKVVIDL